MSTEAKKDADKLIEYSEKIEIIQEKQLQIFQYSNEKLDKVIDFAGKLVSIGELINENKRLDNEKINLQNQFSQILCKHQRDMTIIEKRFEERGLVFSKYFEVYTVGCKHGKMTKGSLVGGTSGRVLCNPAGQADFLNKKGTQLNISMGLCVGHDMIFSKVSDGLVTNLFDKDFTNNNNPEQAMAEIYSQIDRL